MELLIREAKNKSPMLHDSTPEALKKLTIALSNTYILPIHIKV